MLHKYGNIYDPRGFRSLLRFILMDHIEETTSLCGVEQKCLIWWNMGHQPGVRKKSSMRATPYWFLSIYTNIQKQTSKAAKKTFLRLSCVNCTLLAINNVAWYILLPDAAWGCFREEFQHVVDCSDTFRTEGHHFECLLKH